MLAELLLVDDVGMASLANVVAGESHWAGGDFGDGRAAIVSVLSEAAGDDDGTQAYEGNQRDGHNSGETDEMFRVLEQVMRQTLGASCAKNCAMLLDNLDLGGER